MADRNVKAHARKLLMRHDHGSTPRRTSAIANSLAYAAALARLYAANFTAWRSGKGWKNPSRARTTNEDRTSRDRSAGD